MKKQVLIITHTKDNRCVIDLQAALAKYDAEGIRLNVDRYPEEALLTSTFDGEKWNSGLVIEGKNYRLDEFAAVYHRRWYNLGESLKNVLEKDFLGPAIKESDRTIKGMLQGLDVFQLNGYINNRIGELKEAGLKVAHELGLKIPKTCITNNPEEAKAFLESCGGSGIVKMQAGFAIYDEDNKEQVVFTNKVTVDELAEELSTLQYCPMQFQELIPRKTELRVTVIGNKCFAMALSVDKTGGAEQVDWRRVGNETSSDWEPYDLPEDIAAKLVAYHRHFNMNYGATDIMVTPDNEYVFLESNPGGEYFWIDLLLNGALSDQLAKVLLGIATRVDGSSSIPTP